MQVLIPFDDLARNCEVLSDEHLEDARNQVVAVLEAIAAEGTEPATRMWRQDEAWLAKVGLEYCMEWMTRGHECDVIRTLAARMPAILKAEPPAWWGGPVHESHQSLMVRKWPSVYREHFPDVSDEIALVWAGPENEAFFAHREVGKLEREAARAQEAAARARQRADDARRAASQDAAAARRQQELADRQGKSGNNGWK